MKPPIKIVKDTKYPSMHRLEWKDGVQSADFYNKTRAVEILKNYAYYRNITKKLGRNPF